jgi:catechol 2,3-dioxygenase-like lactoylglutathione lyase family enzyme
MSSIFVLDQDQALEFYTTVLGLEVVDDVDFGTMRWLTVRVPGTDHAIILERPGPPAHDEATAEQIRELVTKGAGGGWLAFTTSDVRAAYERLEAAGVEITQEPMEQPYGTDFAVRDPFGNSIRIGQLNS